VRRIKAKPDDPLNTPRLAVLSSRRRSPSVLGIGIVLMRGRVVLVAEPIDHDWAPRDNHVQSVFGCS
jgi:hypothetical protein